jgi:hypothetical protein
MGNSEGCPSQGNRVSFCVTREGKSESLVILLIRKEDGEDGERTWNGG